MPTNRPKPKAAKTAATPGGGAATAHFDPFNATLEEAQAAQDAWLGSDADPRGPIYQWANAAELKIRKESIEKGDGFGVLAAVETCALHGLVIPEWLATLFLRRYRHVQRLRGSSWDDDQAFGRPYPKGRQLAAMRRDRDQRIKVWLLVRDLQNCFPEVPRQALWEEFDRDPSPSAMEPSPLLDALATADSASVDGAEITRMQEVVDRVHAIGVRSTKAQELFAEASRLHYIGPGSPATCKKVAGRLRMR